MIDEKPCTIVSINPEDDNNDSLQEQTGRDLYDVLSDVEDLFARCGVRPDSTENPFEACVTSDGKVLGASFVGIYSSTPDDADDQRRPRYSFSVVVDEGHRRKGIAKRLVESVIASFPKDEVLLEGKVVNPYMADLLSRMGFYYDDEHDDEWSDLDLRIGRRMYRPNPDYHVREAERALSRQYSFENLSGYLTSQVRIGAGDGCSARILKPELMRKIKKDIVENGNARAYRALFSQTGITEPEWLGMTLDMRVEPETALKVVRLMEHPPRNTGSWEVMERINDMLDMHGVERAECRRHDRNFGLYCNAGDTDVATVIWDHDQNQYVYTSWGEFIDGRCPECAEEEEAEFGNPRHNPDDELRSLERELRTAGGEDVLKRYAAVVLRTTGAGREELTTRLRPFVPRIQDLHEVVASALDTKLPRWALHSYDVTTGPGGGWEINDTNEIGEYVELPYDATSEEVMEVMEAEGHLNSDVVGIDEEASQPGEYFVFWRKRDHRPQGAIMRVFEAQANPDEVRRGAERLAAQGDEEAKARAYAQHRRAGDFETLERLYDRVIRPLGIDERDFKEVVKSLVRDWRDAGPRWHSRGPRDWTWVAVPVGPNQFAYALGVRRHWRDQANIQINADEITIGWTVSSAPNRAWGGSHPRDAWIELSQVVETFKRSDETYVHVIPRFHYTSFERKYWTPEKAGEFNVVEHVDLIPSGTDISMATGCEIHGPDPCHADVPTGMMFAWAKREAPDRLVFSVTDAREYVGLPRLPREVSENPMHNPQDDDFQQFVQEVRDDFERNKDDYAFQAQRLLNASLPGNKVVDVELHGSYRPGGSPTPESDVDIKVYYSGPAEPEEVIAVILGKIVNHAGAGVFDVWAVKTDEESALENPGQHFVETESPLDYHGHHPTRLALIDESIGAPKSAETYFADTQKTIRYAPSGRQLKKPKIETVPGAGPGVVGFVDFDVDPTWLTIHFMSVRQDQRGHGYMAKLLDELLTRHGGAQFINFGDVHSDKVWKYVERLRSRSEFDGRVRAKIRNPSDEWRRARDRDRLLAGYSLEERVRALTDKVRTGEIDENEVRLYARMGDPVCRGVMPQEPVVDLFPDRTEAGEERVAQCLFCLRKFDVMDDTTERVSALVDRGSGVLQWLNFGLCTEGEGRHVCSVAVAQFGAVDDLAFYLNGLPQSAPEWNSGLTWRCGCPPTALPAYEDPMFGDPVFHEWITNIGRFCAGCRAGRTSAVPVLDDEVELTHYHRLQMGYCENCSWEHDVCGFDEGADGADDCPCCQQALQDMHEDEHPYDVEPEFDQDAGDISTEDNEHWYQYGKLYFTGTADGLRDKMNLDGYWPNVFSISDHGNAHLIRWPTEEIENDDDEDEASSNPAKFAYLGQCDRLRETAEGDSKWQAMMAEKKPISMREFEEACDVAILLDEGETLKQFVKGDPDAGFYSSHWGSQRCMFVQTAGFEFIFVDDSTMTNPPRGDESMRELERQAATGDQEAVKKLEAARSRLVNRETIDEMKMEIVDWASEFIGRVDGMKIFRRGIQENQEALDATDTRADRVARDIALQEVEDEFRPLYERIVTASGEEEDLREEMLGEAVMQWATAIYGEANEQPVWAWAATTYPVWRDRLLAIAFGPPEEMV